MTISRYDILGRRIETVDARGTVTQYAYDIATGAMTQMIQDAGGLNLFTNYTVDFKGDVVLTSLGTEYQRIKQSAAARRNHRGADARDSTLRIQQRSTKRLNVAKRPSY